jgi:hypothetical protein
MIGQPTTDDARVRPRLSLGGITRLLVGILLVGIRLNEAFAAPSALLFDATLDEARTFAVDSAYARGWSVPRVGQDTAELEYLLEDGETEDALVLRTLIRISALFSEEAAGTRVTLRALEIETSETGEWMSDVTERYAGNLDNALASLVSKWDRHRGSHSIAGQRTSQVGEVRTTAESVGVWAYYAERYAESRGCELTDAGALLDTSGTEWERHQVDCRDGRSFRIHCEHGDCSGVAQNSGPADPSR